MFIDTPLIQCVFSSAYLHLSSDVCYMFDDLIGMFVSSWISQHRQAVRGEDACYGAAESPQYGVWKLQVDRVRRGLPPQTRGVCSHSGSGGKGNTGTLFR